MGMEIPGISPAGKPDFTLLETHPRGASVAPRNAAGGSSAILNEQEIQQALHTLQQTFELFNRRLQFSVNREINRIVVKVIDRTTDKVIKEIPPEEIQHMAARMREMVGLLVDENI